MKIWVINKKVGIIYSLIFVLIISLIYIGRNSTMFVANPQKELPIYCVDTNEKNISFSFDAAWGNEDTDKILKIFDKYGLKTTFFVVGGWVEKYPDSVKSLFNAGHEVMNHSDTHPHMTDLSADSVKKEIEKCDEKIYKATNIKPHLFRAPYGEYDDEVIRASREIGYQAIQWDVDSLDWKDLSSKEIYDRVVSKVKPGSIVLFHNGAKHTAESLPSIIEKLQSDGYEIIPVSKLLFKENFTIDNAGKQKLENVNEKTKK
ncbi:MAG: polysaccharide deacetylase family protein [Clostridiales bacterium]|jgi:polysaccharide deacetylase family sporulation protein PdaB|nr:polysaccharide deacetylase family protein [Clostridiales bacterium]